MLRDWGAEKKYEHLLKGYNYRMEGLQGAILRVKLRHLEQWNEARRAHAAAYSRLLGAAGVRTPKEMSYARHVYTVYTIRSERRAELRQQLEATGVQTAIHYPIPVHLQPAYMDLGYRAGDFPVSEEAARAVLALPIFPEMTENQLHSVVEVFSSARAQVK